MLSITKLSKYIIRISCEIRFYLVFYIYEKPKFFIWRLRNRSLPIRIACIKPFIDMEIDQVGECYLCCKGWMPFAVGNLNKYSIDKVFNSVRSKSVRISIYMGDMKYCNKSLCNIINSKNHKYITAENIYENVFDDEELVSRIAKMKLEMPSPRMLTEVISERCNIKCRFCWTPYAVKQTNTKALTIFSDYVMKNIDTIKMLSFAGGEPLIQKHVTDIMTSAQHKPVKFYITSNLNYISDEMKLMLKNINIDLFHASLNAADKNTYDSVVCGGNWHAVIDNLKYIIELKKSRNSHMRVHISMVVTSSNYMNIPDFVRFGLDNFVDKIIFYPMNEYSYAEQKSMQLGLSECCEINNLLKDDLLIANSDRIEVEALRRFVRERTKVSGDSFKTVH